MARLSDSVRDSRSTMLANNWWLVAFRGALAIVFGLIAIFLPGAALMALVVVFAVYSLVDGVIHIVLALRGAGHHDNRWALLLVNGIAGVLIGVIALAMPGLAVVVFALMVAAWALISAVLMFGSALHLRPDHGRWLLMALAVVSGLYGILLLAAPFVGALVWTWWIGAYAIVFGITLLIWAFRLRPHRHQPGERSLASTGSGFDG